MTDSLISTLLRTIIASTESMAIMCKYYIAELEKHNQLNEALQLKKLVVNLGNGVTNLTLWWQSHINQDKASTYSTTDIDIPPMNQKTKDLLDKLNKMSKRDKE